MDESTTTEARRPAPNETKDPLTEICREGARKMLAAALEAEVEDFVGRFADVVDADGRRVVRRNGYAQDRTLQTGLGDVEVRAPCVRDDRKDSAERIRFTSAILPPYLRRTKAVEELLPWLYLTRKDAEHAFSVFAELFGAKYARAVACLEKDREELLAFHDFPAERWTHLRTTNPIESTFATVRLRTRRTKGSGSAKACLAMVFKLALAAQRKWRKLNASQLLADVITGVRFQDGIKVAA